MRRMEAKGSFTIPAQYVCPTCHKLCTFGIPISGYSNRSIDVHNPGYRAEDNAKESIKNQMRLRVSELYQMSPIELGAIMGDKCPACSEPLPWRRTKEEIDSEAFGHVFVFVFTVCFIIFIIWLISCLVSGFSIAFLIYTVCSAVLFWVLCRVSKKKGDAEKKSCDKERREQEVDSIPTEYLPKIVPEKEAVINFINNH